MVNKTTKTNTQGNWRELDKQSELRKTDLESVT